MEFERTLDSARQGFEKSFEEADFYKKQTADDLHLQLLLDLVHPDEGDNILDLGTGNGYIAFAIAGQNPNCEVTGMDIVPATLERNRKDAAEQQYKNLNFIDYDGKTYSFADQSFHTIITRYALHHFSNLEAGFSEMHRILKKDGRLILSDPTPNENDRKGFIDEFMQKKPDGHIRFYTFAEFDTMLQSAGFQFVSNRKSVIRFPRKNPEEYKDLLSQFDKNILDSYEITVEKDEIWITENVLNMVYRKK